MGENKSIKTCTGAYVKAYAPFLIAGLVGLLYHLRMQPMAGDDIFFSEATRDTGLWEYLVHRYFHWTSRVVSECILVNIIQVPLLWRSIDCLLFITFPVIFAKLFDDSILMRWCGAGAVLLFPFHDMGTAGWITTTVTHFWPLWCIFFVGLLIKKMTLGERIHLVSAVFGVLACVITGSHEQYAVIMMVIFIICGIYLCMHRKKPSNLPLFAVLVCVTVLSLAVIAGCPGNAARNAVSIADLPVYETFGFGDKLYLGLLSIERVFIANADVVYFCAQLIWTSLVYIKTRDYKKTFISAVPLFILFGQTVVRTSYPGLAGLFVMPGEILEWSWMELSTWLPLMYLVISVAAMVYALFQLFGEDLFLFFSVLILLGCGFGAGMVLGFTATIYMSGERVYAPLSASLLFVTLLAVYRQRAAVACRWKTAGGKLVVSVLALLCLVNICFITLSL